MKKISIALIISLLSCMTPQKVPIKGIYLDKPFITYSDKSYDEVWSKIIDIFAQNGFSIKIIDKTSGLIVTEDYSFLNKYTFETPSGNLQNKDAWFVCSSEFNYIGEVLKPDKITGSWNVRIKNENGKTALNVNITNLVANSYIAGTKYSSPFTVNLEVKSTGNFERMISELIK